MLVSIIGKARVGKDISAQYLMHNLNLKAARNTYCTIAFADTLKNHLMMFFDLSQDQVYGDLKEVEDKRYSRGDGTYWTPRESKVIYSSSVSTPSAIRKQFNFWAKVTMTCTKLFFIGSESTNRTKEISILMKSGFSSAIALRLE